MAIWYRVRLVAHDCPVTIPQQDDRYAATSKGNLHKVNLSLGDGALGIDVQGRYTMEKQVSRCR